MRIEQRRVVYGSLIGASSFITGTVLVWLTMPVDQVDELADWRAALWVFLDANGIVVEPGGSQLPLLSETAPEIPTLGIGYVFPFLLVVIGTMLTVSGVSGTARLRYMLENGSTVLYGYLGVGLIALLESGARPALAGMTAFILVIVVATYVGSTVVGKMTGGLPFIGIGSLGLIIILGLIFVVVGVTLLSAILPMIVVAVGGTVTGAGLLWAVRQAPR